MLHPGHERRKQQLTALVCHNTEVMKMKLNLKIFHTIKTKIGDRKLTETKPSANRKLIVRTV